ncbi:MAG: hypothetical protein ACRBI6_22590 [Acidimicrobiales bacterium]
MERKLWKAEELEVMTPADVDDVFDAAVITDLADAPPQLLARTRDRIIRHIEETDAAQRP